MIKKNVEDKDREIVLGKDEKKLIDQEKKALFMKLLNGTEFCEGDGKYLAVCYGPAINENCCQYIQDHRLTKIRFLSFHIFEFSHALFQNGGHQTFFTEGQITQRKTSVDWITILFNIIHCKHKT